MKKILVTVSVILTAVSLAENSHVASKSQARVVEKQQFDATEKALPTIPRLPKRKG